MFRYLEAHTWWSTLDEKSVATIDELLKLCKAGEVERVIIPMTYYGYGASLVDDSNNRAIQRHYRASRFKNVQYNLTMSAQQFIRNEHYRELVEELQEQYPVFDDQDYSELETETKLEHLVDEVSYVLINDEESEVFPLLPDTLAETKEQVEAALLAGDWQTGLDWWEYCEIDTDGATPYSTEDQIAELATLVSVVLLETKESSK